MPKYVVIHGSIRTAEGMIETKVDDGVTEVGELELSAKEAKRMDPTGECLQLKSDYDAEQESKKELAARKKKARLAAPEPVIAGVEEVEEAHPEAEGEDDVEPVLEDEEPAVKVPRPAKKAIVKPASKPVAKPARKAKGG